MSTDLHTLTGAFALDALNPGEADEFTRHLGECEACRDEVREFQAVAARMAAMDATPPPPALKARVLAAADRQAQLPPLVTPLEAARSRRWLQSVGAVAAAIVLVVGTAIGFKALQGGGSEQNTPVATSAVDQVFKASDARTRTIRTSNGGRVQVATSVEVGKVALATRQLPGLKDRVYQAWTISGARIISQGVIGDVRRGKVFAIPAQGTTVAISIEPVGGSTQPTTTPIINVDPQQV